MFVYSIYDFPPSISGAALPHLDEVEVEVEAEEEEALEAALEAAQLAAELEAIGSGVRTYYLCWKDDILVGEGSALPDEEEEDEDDEDDEEDEDDES